jgi:hypothetical protein
VKDCLEDAAQQSLAVSRTTPLDLRNRKRLLSDLRE